MTYHLGSLVSALVDGQLGPADTERALAHVAGCPGCAGELAAAREARRALSVAPDVGPGADLTARLLALGAGGPGACPRGRSQASPGRPRQLVPLGLSAYSAPARALSGELTPRRRPGLRFAVVTLTGLSVATMGLLALGERPTVVPTAHPAQALSMLGHVTGVGSTAAATSAPGLAEKISTAASSGGWSGADDAVLTWMRDGGWTSPEGLPDGYRIAAARLTGDDDSLFELDLAGPEGGIVLTEEHGRLGSAALTGVPRHDVGGASVFVLNRQPWHIAWQSGDTVMSIVSEASTDSVSQFVAAFPDAGYDDGLSARLTRGWHTVAATLTRP